MVEPYVLEHGRAAVAHGVTVEFVMAGLAWVEPRFAALVESPDGRAHGVVCDMDDARWAKMSAHEALYRREWVDVETGVGRERALALLMPDDSHRVDAACPSRRYARLLVRGARAHGLPAEVVERYEDFAVRGSRISSAFPFVVRTTGRLVPWVGLHLAWIMTLGGFLVAVVGAVFGVWWLLQMVA